MDEVTHRQATIADAPFVAQVMMEAVGLDLMEQDVMPDDGIVDTCRREDTLYSYRNATIFELDGKPVGALISYEGKGYHEVKVRTFEPIMHRLDFNPLEMDDETREGEYYLDSAAVLPQYRGRGIGRHIIEHGVAEARQRGLLPVLACDPDNAGAHALYESIGFSDDGTMYIFAHNYLRMTCK